MNVALLALVPLALAGFAVGAFAESWLRALEAAAPAVVPGSWTALPPLLLAGALGACVGARRARGLAPLYEAALWFAAAAGGALLAAPLLDALAPAAAGWRLRAAEWLGVLLPAAGCGAGLALLVEARARAGRPATVVVQAGLALPVVAAVAAWMLRPGRAGADVGDQLLPAAFAAAAAAVACRVLAAWEIGPRAQPAAAVGGLQRASALLALAVGGAALSGGLLLAGRLGQLAATRTLVLGGLLTGLSVQLLLSETLGAWLGAPREARGRVPARAGAGLRMLLVASAIALLCRVLARPDSAGWPLASSLAAVAVLLLLDLARACDPPGSTPALNFGRVTAALLVGVALPPLCLACAASRGEVPGAVEVLRLLLAACFAAALLAALAARGTASGRRVAARWVLGAVAAGLLVAVLGARDSDILPRLDPFEGKVLQRTEGLRHVDTIVGLPGARAELRRDGAPLLDELVNALLARRAGRLAAALAPSAQRAALLLRGDGHLLAALAATSAAHVTCVEPDAGLVKILPDITYESGQEARAGGLSLELAEPRAWLLGHRGELDLIVGNLFRPDAPGASGWLTVEHFLALRGALAEGGVAVVALPLELLPWPAFERVGAAFLQAFPDARLLAVSLRADAPLVLLAGGLTNGLPGPRALDELLAASPSLAGPNGAPDVYDLYLCDAWTLGERWRTAPPATLAQPWGAWLSAGRASEAPLLARLALRQLADLAVPLETSSLQARPVTDKEDRQLGAELTARSAAAIGLLAARSTQLELQAAAPGELSDDERDELDTRVASALLFAWGAAPGHLDVRDALLERTAALALAGRTEMAATLLNSAVAILPDARLQGVLGGLLLRLGQDEAALELLRAARERAPEDRNVLVNLAAALLVQGNEAAGRAELEAAQRLTPGQSLPPLPAAALGLLRGDPAALAPARAALDALPAGDPWATVLRRLLRLPAAPR